MLHMAERACVDVGSPFQYVAEDEPAADRSGRDGRQGHRAGLWWYGGGRSGHIDGVAAPAGTVASPVRRHCVGACWAPPQPLFPLRSTASAQAAIARLIQGRRPPGWRVCTGMFFFLRVVQACFQFHTCMSFCQATIISIANLSEKGVAAIEQAIPATGCSSVTNQNEFI